MTLPDEEVLTDSVMVQVNIRMSQVLKEKCVSYAKNERISLQEWIRRVLIGYINGTASVSEELSEAKKDQLKLKIMTHEVKNLEEENTFLLESLNKARGEIAHLRHERISGILDDVDRSELEKYIDTLIEKKFDTVSPIFLSKEESARDLKSICVNCEHTVPNDATMCPHCGINFEDTDYKQTYISKEAIDTMRGQESHKNKKDE